MVTTGRRPTGRPFGWRTSPSACGLRLGRVNDRHDPTAGLTGAPDGLRRQLATRVADHLTVPRPRNWARSIPTS